MKDKATCLSQLCDIDTKLNKLQGQISKLTDREKQSGQEDKITRRFENLAKKKSKLLYSFDINLRDYIQKLENKYQNMSVVRVINALCPGCHMRLPTKEALLLRKPNQYVVCSFCGRIILSYKVDTSQVPNTAYKQATD